jgi:cyanophycinase
VAATTRTIKPGVGLHDWTTLVRESRERAMPPFPSAIRNQPVVPHGSLLIVGGGNVTSEMWEVFISKAGGKNARIVILPTAEPEPQSESRLVERFKRMGVQQVTVLPQRDHDSVNSPEFLEVIDSATGIWFGGGRQWRFVDAYEFSQALAAMRRCLERGGIIGGSSAGASIQGELLIRGAPVGNQIMVQNGYRRGFAFFPGVGIDQHFAQRNRFADLEKTIREFPEILGIGVDEATGLLVEKNRGQVYGRGDVYICAAKNLTGAHLDSLDAPADKRHLKFGPGEIVDFLNVETIAD